MTPSESQGYRAVLVTGACGEIGQALVQELAARGGYRIVTADIAPLPDVITPAVTEHVQGDLIYKIKTLYDYDFDLSSTWLPFVQGRGRLKRLIA
jgi:NAD(P)-dependent dehydrogenase (short-subunit alcohol dehydrogenase family)